MFITAVCVLFLIKLRWAKNKSLYETHSLPDFFLRGGGVCTQDTPLNNGCRKAAVVVIIIIIIIGN